MRTCFISCFLSLLAVVGAADQNQALAELSLPDFSRTRERFAASPYGKAWNLPAAQPLHLQLAGLGGLAQMRIGFDPLRLLASLEGVHLRLLPPSADGQPPRLQAQVRGAEAAQMLAKLLAAQPTPLPHQLLDDQLLIATAPELLRAPQPLVSDADFVLRIDNQRLPEVIKNAPGAQPGPSLFFAHIASQLQSVDLRLTERGTQSKATTLGGGSAAIPVDLVLADRLPAQALAVFLQAIDGKALLTEQPELFTAAKEILAQLNLPDLDALLAAHGIADNLEDLLAGYQGTTALCVSGEGGLMPAITVALPRCRTVDRLFQFLHERFGLALPVEGRQTFITLPPNQQLGLRQAIFLGGTNLARSGGYWWLSTDPVMLRQVLAGTSGGWLKTPAAQRALALAGQATPSAIGSGKSPSLLRMVIWYSIAANFVGSPAIGEAIAEVLTELASTVEDDVLVSFPHNGGVVSITDGPLQAAGLLTGFTPLSVIPAIAIPNLLESRVTANENAAATTLKSAIFASQTQFVAGNYNDLDQDNRGEYGFLPHLAGVVATLGDGSGAANLPAGELRLLNEELGRASLQAVNGYHYRIYLPDAEQGAVDFATAQAQSAAGGLDAATINAREKYFIAYAWPAALGDTGRRVFMMTQEGKIYSIIPSADQLPPRWDSALNPAQEGQAPGLRFRDVAWQPYRR